MKKALFLALASMFTLTNAMDTDPLSSQVSLSVSEKILLPSAEVIRQGLLKATASYLLTTGVHNQLSNKELTQPQISEKIYAALVNCNEYMEVNWSLQNIRNDQKLVMNILLNHHYSKSKNTERRGSLD